MNTLHRGLAAPCALALALAPSLAHAQSVPDTQPPPAPYEYIPVPAGSTVYYLPPPPPPPPLVPPPERVRRWEIAVGAQSTLARSSASSTPGTGRSGYSSSVGLSVAYRLRPTLSFGIGQLGAWSSNVGGVTTYSATVSPYLEHTFLRIGRLEMYGQLGMLLEMNSTRGALSASVAAYAGVGARLYLARWLSVGATMRGYYALTNGVSVGDATLSSGQFALAGVLEIGLHF